MLTNSFFATLAARLVEPNSGTGFSVAVGTGEESWDEGLPDHDRATTALVAEVARKPVPAEQVVFLDSSGQPTVEPTPHLQLSVDFTAGEAVGVLRECGLYIGGSDEELGTGTLLSYFTHPRIDKTEAMTLSRTFRIDLTPRAFVPGTRATRYLGNTASTELHDLDNETPSCQISEIRFDHRFYFRTAEEAAAVGYDFCAFCFGRELSER